MKETTMTTKNNTAAYLQFVADLRDRFEANGVELETSEATDTGLIENKGWVCFQSKANQQKFYVPKSVNSVGLCGTTLPLNTAPGARPMKTANGKPITNGKIACMFVADLDLIEQSVVPLMGDTSVPLPANRRPASKKDLSVASEPQHVGSLADVESLPID